MKKLIFTLAIGLFFFVSLNAQSLKSDQAKTQVKTENKVSLKEQTNAKKDKKECDTKKASILSDKKKSCATKKSCANKRRPNSCKD